MARVSLPTVAMTSLVGCAGEDFATILKSLGYAVERRAGPAITVPLVEAPKPVEPQAAPAEGETAAPAEEAPAETSEASVATEEVGAVAVEAPEASVSEQELRDERFGGPVFARRSGSGSL